MKTLILGIVIGAALLVPINPPAEGQVLIFGAEGIVGDADWEILGSGGYSVFILRNYIPPTEESYYMSRDLGLVQLFDAAAAPTSRYVCVEESLTGWDCWRW